MSSIISIWCLAELIYFRANCILLDAHSITMIGNMAGFWSSIFAFIRPLDTVLIIPPLLVSAFFRIQKNSQRRTPIFLSIVVVSIALSIGGIKVIYPETQKPGWWGGRESCSNSFNPFSTNYLGFDGINYSKYTSVVHCLFQNTSILIQLPFENKSKPILEDSEIIQAKPFFSEMTTKPKPNCNLILILFESLESWSVSKESTPNIYDFICRHENILWGKKISSMVKAAPSADGQMIVNTGLLPISSGGTCYEYPNNCFPSLSELYPNSAMIQPGNMAIWNQSMMSKAYHIQTHFIIPSEDDAESSKKMNEIYSDYPYLLLLTMASHAPFKKYSDRFQTPCHSDMPLPMRNYLSCVQYTDSCLSEFLSRVDTDATLQNTTIVITGDHKIFDADMRETFLKFCNEHNYPLTVNEPYCPLIIYSPAIKKKQVIDDVAFQMDIFPTILHLIGCDSTYYWKGFGKNLLYSSDNRNISPEDASILSDKMIRSDYWNTYKKDHNIH